MPGDNYKWGERMTSRLTVVTVTTIAAQVVPAAAGRCGVRFSSPVVNRVTISDRPGPTLDGGWNAYPGTARGPEFCKAVNGTITEGPFFAIAAIGSETIAVLETFGPTNGQ